MKKKSRFKKKIRKIPAIDPQNITADTDLLKMVLVDILLNYGNYFRALQLGF